MDDVTRAALLRQLAGLEAVQRDLTAQIGALRKLLGLEAGAGGAAQRPARPRPRPRITPPPPLLGHEEMAEVIVRWRRATPGASTGDYATRARAILRWFQGRFGREMVLADFSAPIVTAYLAQEVQKHRNRQRTALRQLAYWVHEQGGLPDPLEVVPFAGHLA